MLELAGILCNKAGKCILVGKVEIFGAEKPN